MNASRYDSVDCLRVGTGSRRPPRRMPTRPMPSALRWSAVDRGRRLEIGGRVLSHAVGLLPAAGAWPGRLAVRRLRHGAGLAALEALALGLRHVADAGVLAQLQRADVGDDRPAILRRHLRGVVRHLAEAARHHVVEVAGALVAQPRIVERRRLLVAALHDHAVAVAGDAVAGRAVDVVALASALDDRRGHRHRDLLDRRAGLHAGVEHVVVLEEAARHGALDDRPRRALVRVDVALLERLVAGRVVHVLAAAPPTPRRGPTQRRRERERAGAARSHEPTLNVMHPSRPEALEQLARPRRVELRIVGFDAQEQPVDRSRARGSASR